MDLAWITSDVGRFTRDALLVTRDPVRPGADGQEIVWCNPAFTAMTGYALEDIRGRTPDVLEGPDTDRDTLARIRAALDAREPVLATLQIYTRTGAPVWSEMSIRPVADESGCVHYWVSVQRDVTERIALEADLKARHAALEAAENVLEAERTRLAGIAAVARHAQDLITITDANFSILWANRAFATRSGHAEDSLRGACLFDLLDKRGGIYSSRPAALAAIADGCLGDAEVRNTAHDRTEFWTDLRLSVQCDAAGRPEQFIVVERDITEQRRQRIAIERSRFDLAMAATRDPLTGLPNRLGMPQALEGLAARAEALGHGLGVMTIDLDHFKQINTTLGHAAGDAVLLEVTRRMKARLGPDSVMARVGSDEFVAAVDLRRPDEDLARCADDLVQDLSRPVRFKETDCRCTVSIGLSARLHAPFETDVMLTEADIALNRAKSAGRNRAEAFTEALSRETRARKRLADELTQSVEKQELIPHYQPQIDAATGALAGAEALLRWNHPGEGLIGPRHYLALARDLHLEPKIDRLMLERALEDIRTFRAAGIRLPKISVNVSARRLRQTGLIRELDRLSIPPGSISFELLESTFLDEPDDHLNWTFDAFRERGIGIEIDDFGTGHASIMGLVRVAPQRLKTDKAILIPALEDPRREKLFGLVVEIGAALDIAVTAEGVETEAHADLARRRGCSVLQGYHFGRPLAAADFVNRFAPSRITG